MDIRKPISCALSLVSFASAAQAQCSYCDDSVTLSEVLAQCYLEGIEEHLLQARQIGMPTAVFDLSGCPGAPEQSGTDRSLGLPVPRVANVSEQEPLSMRFIVDLATAGCLAETLQHESFDPDKIRTFDLNEHCGPEE